MGDCEQGLERRLFDEFSYRNESEYDEKVIKIFSYTYDQLKTMNETQQWDAGLDVPLVKKLLSFDASSEQSREEYESIRQQYLSSTDSTVRSRVRVEFSRKVVSSEAVRAYEICVRGRVPLSYEISGNPKESNNFGIAVTYAPKDGDDKDDVLVLDVRISDNLVMTGSPALSPRVRIPKFSSIVQGFQRSNDESAWVLISFQGHDLLKIEIDWRQRCNTEVRPVRIPARRLPTYVPPHVGGDKDFSGKLMVDARVSVLIVEGTRLVAQVQMTAAEPVPDFTKVTGSTSLTDVNYLLYEASKGERILRVTCPQTLWETISFPSGGGMNPRLGEHSPFSLNPDQWHDTLIPQLLKLPMGLGQKIINAMHVTRNGLVAEWAFVGDTDAEEAGTLTSVAVALKDLNIDVEVVKCQ